MTGKQSFICLEALDSLVYMYCCCGSGECADLREPAADVRLHSARRILVQPVGELGAAGRRLLLLHYAVDDRLRRLRAGYQPGLVALAEERRVWSLPGLRSGADRHVFQLDAGRGAQQVPTTWTSSWSHQLDVQSRSVSTRDARIAKILRYCTLRAVSSPIRRSRRKLRNLTAYNDT